LSKDPVALDTIGMNIIKEKKRESSVRYLIVQISRYI